MHPDVEQIELLAHGELEASAAATLERHLEACPACRAQLAAARREEEELHGLLCSLDHPLPRVDAHDVAARARTRPSGWMRWASGVALALAAAGGAYAAPASPIPRWLDRVLGATEEADERRAAPPAAAASTPDGGGIAVAPGAGLIIVFAAPQERGTATLRLTSDREVVVRAQGGAPTFTSELDRLRIDNGGTTGDFEIRIPQDATRIEVWVGDRRAFLKEGSRVTTDVSADAAGAYLLPLTGPGE